MLTTFHFSMRLYTDGDKHYLSVTTVLDLYDPFDADGFNKWALENGKNPAEITKESNRVGTIVHNWVENAYLGISKTFDYEPQNEIEEGYYRAVSLYLQDFELFNSEVIVAEKQLGYCGRFDVRARRRGENQMRIQDFKTWGSHFHRKDYTGSKQVLDKKKVKVAQQLSLYRKAYGVDDGIDVVHFLPDGTYRLYELTFDEGIISWVKTHQKQMKEKVDELLLNPSCEIVTLW